MNVSRRELHGPPPVDLLFQRIEVPLHPIDADGQAVFQGKVLRVLRQDGGIHAWDYVSELKRTCRTPVPVEDIWL